MAVGQGAAGQDTGAARAGMARGLARLDRAIGWVTELPAALLVVVEVAVLFAGVVSRYVFNRPLTWTDELASALFLWLAMLGAVIAFRRGEHMRLTAIVGFASPAWRARWDVLGSLVVALFVLEILAPARD
jgi:TRAP-type C4-dicarboxylate transport system permease small subunit